MEAMDSHAKSEQSTYRRSRSLLRGGGIACVLAALALAASPCAGASRPVAAPSRLADADQADLKAARMAVADLERQLEGEFADRLLSSWHYRRAENRPFCACFD